MMAQSEDDALSFLHPRQTEVLAGHEKAEKTFLDALESKRMHHAWLITGPRGIGKATLAYRMARHLLRKNAAGGSDMGPSLFGDAPLATTLDMASDHPVFTRVSANSHGNLMTVERGWDERKKALRGEIVIDDVRKVHSFFTRTASEDGWRICIIDSSDEMNRNAANALLKILEEPPENGLLLLISHSPGRLLPTIRSRCRTLSLAPLTDQAVADVLQKRFPDLSAQDMAAIAVLAEGAPGRALDLAQHEGLTLYRLMVSALSRMPGFDIPDAHSLAGKLSLKAADHKYRIFTALLLNWLERLVRSKARGLGMAEIVSNETEICNRFTSALPLDRQGELWEKMSRLLEQADRAHLDKKQVILRLLAMMDAAFRGQLSA